MESATGGLICEGGLKRGDRGFFDGTASSGTSVSPFGETVMGEGGAFKRGDLTAVCGFSTFVDELTSTDLGDAVRFGGER